MKVVRQPVDAHCKKKGCRGTMWRLTLSRLEEALGHEGFECSSCKERVKYVPPA